MPTLGEKYTKLRQMEEFTNEMFNRIVAFQEKEHLAWDPQQDFSTRIKDLPLHNLIFSLPDRDPQTHSHTVAAYYPLRDEMQMIAWYAQQVAAKPKVCDVHCGNGFIGSLLGQEGLNVVGLRSPQQKPNQIESFYDARCFEVVEGDLESAQVDCDVIFSAWMPSGQNLTPAIVKRKPKLIVYVHTEHGNPETGERQTGVEGAFTGLPDNYKLIDDWSITRPQDLLHEIWPDLTPSLEEERFTKIYADTPFHHLDRPNVLAQKPAYDWEAELEMALLALEAKSQLLQQGSGPR